MSVLNTVNCGDDFLCVAVKEIKVTVPSVTLCLFQTMIRPTKTKGDRFI